MSNKNILRILVLFAIFAVSTGIVTAESPPNFPMGLYGDVNIGGSPAPAGTRIDAKVGDDVKASNKVVNSGKYGYLGAYAPTDGTMIDVYVNDVKVTSIAYASGKSTRLDLNAPGGTSGGNGGTTGGSSGSTGGGGVSSAGGVTPKATAIQQQAAASKETAPVPAKATPVTTPTPVLPVTKLSTILGVFGLLAIGAIALYALKKMGKI